MARIGYVRKSNGALRAVHYRWSLIAFWFVMFVAALVFPPLSFIAGYKEFNSGHTGFAVFHLFYGLIFLSGLYYIPIRLKEMMRVRRQTSESVIFEPTPAPGGVSS